MYTICETHGQTWAGIRNYLQERNLPSTVSELLFSAVEELAWLAPFRLRFLLRLAREPSTLEIDSITATKKNNHRILLDHFFFFLQFEHKLVMVVSLIRKSTW